MTVWRCNYCDNLSHPELGLRRTAGWSEPAFRLGSTARAPRARGDRPSADFAAVIQLTRCASTVASGCTKNIIRRRVQTSWMLVASNTRAAALR